MFNYIFKKIYLIVKKNMEKGNLIRVNKEKLPAGITRTEHIYLNSGNHLHHFNLYKQSSMEDTKGLPLIIDIHGGGWICGDKDTNNNFNYHLALGGYNVTSLSYRTIDHCTIKEQIQDIYDYLHFLKEHDKDLGISFEKVILTGDSAGGQLALLSYCINQNKKLQKLFSVKHIDLDVKCLVLNHSVCYIDEAGRMPDIPLLSRLISITGLQTMIYGMNFTNKKLYQNTYNPSRYISKDTPLPPTLLITSKGDKTFEYQTKKLYQYLMKLGKKCKLYLEKDVTAEHVFNIAYPDSETGKKCNTFILNYINEV